MSARVLAYPVWAMPAVAGCAARNDQAVAVDGGPAAVDDVQQAAGQIAAAVRSEIMATGVGRDITGYRSEFGIGAVLVVALTLILALVLSHRREMARIQRRNGSA